MGWRCGRWRWRGEQVHGRGGAPSSEQASRSSITAASESTSPMGSGTCSGHQRPTDKRRGLWLEVDTESVGKARDARPVTAGVH